MKVVRTCLAVAIAGLISIGSLRLNNQRHLRVSKSGPKTPEPVSGELVSIATDSKTVVVKTSGDKEMTFSYTDQTEIVGADKGAAGLATMTGSPVTVHYTGARHVECCGEDRSEAEEVGFSRRAEHPRNRSVRLCVPLLFWLLATGYCVSTTVPARLCRSVLPDQR
jgi:hypothetical protein